MLVDHPINHFTVSVAILDANLHHIYGKLFNFQPMQLCYYTVDLEKKTSFLNSCRCRNDMIKTKRTDYG